MGMVLVSTLISCLDPSFVLDVISLPSSSSQVEEEAEGIVPFSRKVSLGYPSLRSYLDPYLSGVYLG